jgi:hypothetical protein
MATAKWMKISGRRPQPIKPQGVLRRTVMKVRLHFYTP